MPEQINAPASSGTFLNFMLDETLMAIPVERVREILDARDVQNLPQAPDYIMGYIDLRGDSIVVVDLRTLIGRPFRKDDVDTRIVVLWVEDEGREQVLALRTDKVTEVSRFDDDRIEPIETGTMLNWDHRIVSGLARRNGSYVTLLDLDRLLSSKIISSLDKHVEDAMDGISA